MRHIQWFENIIVPIRISLILLCVGALGCPASAQTAPHNASTKGFSVGGHVAIIGSSPDSVDVNGQHTDIETVTTIGGGATIAYGVNDWLTVFLNGDGHESDEDRHLAFADLGAQLFLWGRSGFRPHLDIAFTGRRADFDAAITTVDTRGASLSFGGGVLYFMSPSFAIDGTLLRTEGDLDRYVDGQRVRGADGISVPATRLLVGVRWFPGR
jgi:hypothetical protein